MLTKLNKSFHRTQQPWPLVPTHRNQNLCPHKRLQFYSNLFATGKTWKQSKCPLGMDKVAGAGGEAVLFGLGWFVGLSFSVLFVSLSLQ